MQMKKIYLFLMLVALLVTAGCKIQVQTIPAAPGNLQIAETTTTTIKLVWIDKSSDETGFYLYRGTAEGAVNALAATLGKDVTTFTDQGLTPATKYYYRLVAFNSYGSSPSSNTVSGTTQQENAGVSEAPANLTVQEITGSTVKLSWVDNCNREIQFRVYYGTNAGTMTDQQIVETNVVTSTIVDLKPLTTYYFKVTALTDDGETESSNIVSATTIDTVPAAPGNLWADYIGYTNVWLGWQDVSNNEDGFRIYQGTTLVGTVGTNEINYEVQNLQDNTSYVFKVVAFNEIGESAGLTVTTKTLTASDVTGTIVNSEGVNVGGALITLGDHQTVTSSDGTFAFSEIIPGDYFLQVQGGDTHHYWSYVENLTLIGGVNSLGNVTAYKMRGIGVITQNVINTQNSTLSTGQKSTLQHKRDIFSKSIFPTPTMYKTAGREPSLNTFSDLENEDGFVAIQWEKGPVEVEYYEIISQDSLRIWSSQESHPEDPTFDPTNPSAYLDFGYELASMDLTPGEKEFIIIGCDSNGNTVYSLPVLKATLGTLLETYPTGIAKSGTELTWKAVVGADEYRVLVYDYDTGAKLADSGAITTNSYILPSALVAGTHYKVYVDAYAQGGTGWTQEITRGIRGFTMM